tara:strand:+ start:1818 stop:2663 length:846 start_codon:yes stop_codon:yes gene_type:complete
MKKYLSITIISLLVFSAFFFAFDKSGAEKMKNKKGNHTMNDENINDKEFKTKSGLIYEIIKLGEGEKPNATDKVEVHYHGTLEDGSVFDSSVDRNQTITFGLNQVIKGWTEGLQLMPVGSKFKFTIPPELGYGDRDMGSIPPNSTLIFEVELFDIKKPFVDKDFSLPAEEITTESGLRYLEHISGDGEVTQTGNVVVVHYSGFLSDGTKFDSSHDRARPFNFTLGENRVIKGWEEGLLNMKKGAKRTLIIPPELGYGSRGAGGVIPPDATLVFEVELIDFK